MRCARSCRNSGCSLRFKAPIFTYKNILDKAGIYLKPAASKNPVTKEETSIIEDMILDDSKTPAKDDYSRLSVKELNKMLEDAVKNENYEVAARVRDEISKRQ